MSILPASSDPHRLSGQRLALAIGSLAVGGFAIGTTEFTIMGLLEEMRADLGVDYAEGGQVISAYALGVVIGAPVLATIGAKKPQRTVALALMLVITLANLSSFFASGFGWMLASRFLSGLPHGAYFGVAAVIAASLADPAKRGRAIAMVMLGLSIANVIGVPFATWLGQQFGWRSMFLLVGVIGMGTLFLIRAFVPALPVRPGASIRTELGALRSPQLWLTLLIGIVGFGGFFAVYSYISPIMTEVAGLGAALLPLVVALYGVGMVVGNILGGRLADRSIMGSIYGAMVTITAVLLLFPLAATMPWSACLFVFLVGASGSTLIPPLQARLLDVSPDAPSLASSMNHSALNTANALGATVGGAVITAGWGFTSPALVGAVLAVLGLGVAVVSGRMDRRAGGQGGRRDGSVVAPTAAHAQQAHRQQSHS
ncbi:MFS transporter [Arthrobacter agilis]|uniref:MFS transporter n=1 Tax=Arthrobacter agilis TaxID=37921 RepID=UPI000B35C996|nr:MFS transporter [Arthrobacter agilis]OUM40331.1 MFS transporter [Arthrobacter agilis]PPB44943.1 MFS transporter [Arthrobacter agilis]TPV27648.1 MFS transporter [Arthrobacter agilis]VDR31727.1 Inner membrane transport protein ydhP [Arthrobacter agilis]